MNPSNPTSTPPTKADSSCAKAVRDEAGNYEGAKIIAAHRAESVRLATEPLLSRIAELEKDRARLEWVEKSKSETVAMNDGAYWRIESPCYASGVWIGTAVVSKKKTLRAAIDAAMLAQKSQP